MSALSVDPSDKGRLVRKRADSSVKLLARMSDNFTGGVNAVVGVEGCAFRTQDVVYRSPNVLIALASLSFRPS